MRAAVFAKPYNLEIKEYSLQRLKQKELLVKVEVCGLCGTDFHIYTGESYSKPPVIPGHEYTGVVVDKGEEVFNLNIGDHVVIDPNIYCGECDYCRNGKINFCTNLMALGVTLNGGFAEYSIVPVSQAYFIPEDLSFRTAAFAEPLSCCLRGMDNASIKLGESVAIIGGGTIGLLMLQLVKISGAGKILLIEPIEEKRKLAEMIGADYVFDPFSSDMRKNIDDLTSGGPDIVIECAGNSAAANLAVSLPKRGGRAVLFGLSEKKDILEMKLQDFFYKELSIRGSLLNPFTFSRSVELLAAGKVKPEKLNPISSRLNELEMILSKPRNSSVIKYQIIPN